MMHRYRPTEIPVVSAPITSSNLRNACNQPVIDLGRCTPFQMLGNAEVDQNGTVCVIGEPERSIRIARALIRRSRKPFLLVGPSEKHCSVLLSLKPDWVHKTASPNPAAGNGAFLLEKPHSAYLEVSEYLEDWSQNHFLVLYLASGFQIGPHLLDLLGTTGQCLVICESVPQAVRSDEGLALTVKDFLQKMDYLMVFGAGSATKELIELLPTYQYERIQNTTTVNTYSGRSAFHPLHRHRGHGTALGQIRSIDDKKSLFEMQELQKISAAGTMLLYCARKNLVFLADVF